MNIKDIRGKSVEELQSELQKLKEQKHLEQIEMLQRKIESLTTEVKLERESRKVKPLPFQRFNQ